MYADTRDRFSRRLEYLTFRVSVYFSGSESVNARSGIDIAMLQRLFAPWKPFARNRARGISDVKYPESKVALRSMQREDKINEIPSMSRLSLFGREPHVG